MLVAVAFGVPLPVRLAAVRGNRAEAPDNGAARVRRLLAGTGKWLLAAGAGAVIYAFIDHRI